MKNAIILLFFGYICAAQTEQVTYTEHISPIIYNKCVSCHRSGESGPMTLTSYEEVAAISSMIGYVTENNYMPPWPPDPTYTPHSMLDERFLTDQEKNLITEWIAQGAIEGDPEVEAEIPNFIEGSAIGEPDYIFELEEEYFIEGNNLDDYRVFVFPTNFTEDTYIKAIEFRPDNREAVHHALLMADVTGTGASQDAESPDVLGYEAFGGFNLEGVSPNDYVFLGGYAPGMNPIVWHGDLGMKIPAGADILCQIHYAPSSIDEWDKSSINLFTKPASEVEREVQMKMWLRVDLDIPANSETTIEACLNFSNSFLDFLGPGPIEEFGIESGGEQNCELPESWSLLGILPHSHLMGKSWEVYAETPEGEIIPIIKIPNWDFDWQGFYYPEYMQHIPQGSRIEAVATYENTNDFNMTWGELTTDEMFFCPIYYVPYESGDENIYLGMQDPTINLVSNSSGSISIFPNPSRENITIEYNFLKSDQILAKLYNSKGQLVKIILDENFQSGTNSIKLDVSGLSKGAYFISIQTNSEIVIESFMKE